MNKKGALQNAITLSFRAKNGHVCGRFLRGNPSLFGKTPQKRMGAPDGKAPSTRPQVTLVMTDSGILQHALFCFFVQSL